MVAKYRLKIDWLELFKRRFILYVHTVIFGGHTTAI